MTFRIGETVGTVHGPGKIIGIERQEIAGAMVDFFAIDLPKSRLLVPLDRTHTLRPLSTPAVISDALVVLGTKPKGPRGPWYPAALRYERKVHSGDLLTVASVVRDLHRRATEIGSSPSRIYRMAFDLLAQEIAAVEELSAEAASDKIVSAIGVQSIFETKAGRKTT
jgi:CarD family transcriptional regulator